MNLNSGFCNGSIERKECILMCEGNVVSVGTPEFKFLEGSSAGTEN